MYLSRLTAAFRRFKSTQSLTWALFFKTGTIGAHHSVGFVTGSMMSASVSRSNSVFTLSSNGIGTLLATLKEYGSAFGSSSIVTGSVLRHPKVTVGVTAPASMRAISPKPQAASRPRRFSPDMFTTTTLNLYLVPFQIVLAVKYPLASRGPPGLTSDNDFKGLRGRVTFHESLSPVDTDPKNGLWMPTASVSPTLLAKSIFDTLEDRQTGQSCASGWKLFSNKCYYYIDSNGVNFNTAVTSCTKVGAALTKITSEEENNFVTDLAKQNGLGQEEDFWIGLSRDWNGDGNFGSWTWSDGIELQDTDYQKWTGGEPLVDEGCPKIRGSTEWYGFVCEALIRGFVCEKDVPETPPPATTPKPTTTKQSATPEVATKTDVSSVTSASVAASSTSVVGSIPSQTTKNDTSAYTVAICVIVVIALILWSIAAFLFIQQRRKLQNKSTLKK
uniref:C-type lectin domain-containing protein n=1 Tax=Capitella teleta TaxID=283909 RepID=X2A412_CAPTE